MSWKTKKLKLPKGAMPWPEKAAGIGINRIRDMYKDGFLGAMPDPEAKEELMESQAVPDGDVISSSTGMADTGKGKLSIPFIYVCQHYPKILPGIPQATGNCVAKADKNALLLLYGVECAVGEPDELTGEIEGWIDLDESLQPHGLFVWEHYYGERGHRGQGANCSKLVLVLTKHSGAILRKNYEGIVDFTKENTNLSIKWGGRGVPQNILDLGKPHPVRNAADVPTHEVARDFIHNGYPIKVCSSLGFSDVCDKNGVAKRQGSWGHSWIVAGYDDRSETIAMYGCPLFLFIHDWGLWNSNTKGIIIHGTDVKIPPGAFWADARLLDECDMTVLSGLTGFARKTLPDWSGNAWG